jgi:hypothetical protein
MGVVTKSELPAQALLQSYRRDGHHTDCYSTEIPRAVSQSQFIAAFYTTFLFKIERFILKVAVSRPSTDDEALLLSEQRTDSFAAWNVEAQDDDQLLLCDFQGKTRSWLMVEALSLEDLPRTRLYFGSAVIKTSQHQGEKRSLPSGFRPLLWFHHLYSIALLHSARRRLERETIALQA